ncbi:MAG TPA: alpha/beta hydrolase [Hyphomicrobiales bacterium]|nr:alpha/beta hydrolase [Hyphomicrobiales bacterium]
MTEAAAPAVPVREWSLRLHDRVVAGRLWGAEGAPLLLALHGWRDNAATFDRLAPRLADSFRVLALDLPGHGRSDPRQRDGGYAIWSYLDDVLAILQTLGEPRVRLLGHSMGAAVACLFAATFPERVESVVMLDALGPLSVPPTQAPAQLRKALLQKADWNPAQRSYYPSREAAIEARARVGLRFDSAALLAARNLGQDAQGWYWQSDRRLARANPLSLSEEQVQAFLREIRCPVLLVKATGGDYWHKHAAAYAERLRCFAAMRTVELPGHHHQHLEGEVEAVAQAVRDFLER